MAVSLVNVEITIARVSQSLRLLPAGADRRVDLAPPRKRALFFNRGRPKLTQRKGNEGVARLDIL